MKNILKISTLSLIMLPALSGYAKDINGSMERSVTSSLDRSFTVGMAAITAPKYSGSDEQSTGLSPYFSARYDQFFIDSVYGLGINLESDNGLYLISSLGYSGGRSDKDSKFGSGSDKLKGMGKIDSTLNTNLVVGWAIANWASVEAAASAPLTDSQGMNYTTSIILTPYESESDLLTVQASALFGDSRYLNTWYGVSEKQSVDSGNQRYNASSGFYGTDIGFIWSHQFSEHWSTDLTYDYTWLSDRVSESPIVKKRGGSTAAVAVNYTF